MSGTSTDGADVILADFAESIPRVLGFHSETFPPLLRAELLALNISGDNEIERSQLAASALAVIYASAINKLLVITGISPQDVIATGCHGQIGRAHV